MCVYLCEYERFERGREGERERERERFEGGREGKREVCIEEAQREGSLWERGRRIVDRDDGFVDDTKISRNS